MARFSIMFCFLVLICIGSTHGQTGHFNITGTEPLSQGDTITITNSEYFTTLHTIIAVWYRFYYDGIAITPDHPVPDEMWDLTLDPQFRITGTTQLDIGSYSWATEVQVIVGMVYLGQIRTFNSRNLLATAPTTLPVPSMSTWSMILLLSIFGLLLLQRGR